MSAPTRPPPASAPKGKPTSRPTVKVPQFAFRNAGLPSPGPTFANWVEVALAANLVNSLAKDATRAIEADPSARKAVSDYYEWKSYLLRAAIAAGVPELRYDAKLGVLYWSTPVGQFSFHLGIIRRMQSRKHHGPYRQQYAVPFNELAPLHADSIEWTGDIMQPRARELWMEWLQDEHRGLNGLEAGPAAAPALPPDTRMGSLFSGGGGWEEGGKMAGLRPMWGVELDPHAAGVWQANNPWAQMHQQDLRTVDVARLPPVRVLVTSPPCQGYSQARARGGLEQRCDLTVGLDTLRYVEALRPGAVLLEEVPAFAKSSILKKLSAGMKRLGFDRTVLRLRAELYGLPSRRDRLYVVWTGPGASFDPGGLVERQTSWDAALAGLRLPVGRPLTPRQLKGLRAKPVRQWPTLLSAAWKVTTAGNEAVFHTDAGRAGPPVTASYEGMVGWRILHADGALNEFTPRCAARLMSFPDTYTLPNRIESAWRVVGNAVAPLMAAQLFRCLRLP